MKKVQNFKYLGSQSNDVHGKEVKKKGRSEEHCKLDVLEIKQSRLELPGRRSGQDERGDVWT